MTHEELIRRVRAVHLNRVAWGVCAGREVQLPADSPVTLLEARAHVRRLFDEEHAQRVVVARFGEDWPVLQRSWP